MRVAEDDALVLIALGPRTDSKQRTRKKHSHKNKYILSERMARRALALSEPCLTLVLCIPHADLSFVHSPYVCWLVLGLLYVCTYSAGAATVGVMVVGDRVSKCAVHALRHSTGRVAAPRVHVVKHRSFRNFGLL